MPTRRSHRRFGDKDFFKDVSIARVVINTAPAPIGIVDHGGLSGLGDDDHSQYVHLSAARIITGQHSFSPTVPQAPFALGANAQGQTVTGLKADQLNKSITAGAGLSGGGALIADISLAIGAGDGITVNADSVQVRLSSPANPGMYFDGGGLKIGAGTGITVDPASVAINQAFSPTWTGLHTFNRAGAPFAIGASSLDQLVTGLNADKLDGLDASDFALSSIQIIAGAGLTGGGALTANVTLTVGAGAGITVNPDDVALTTPGTLTATTANSSTGNHTHAITASDSPGVAVSLLKTSAAGRLTLEEFAATSIGSNLIPLTTDTYDLGSSLKLWRKGWLSELDAILFAQQTITLLGGWFIVGKDEGAVAADVTDVATTVDFGKAMTNGHFVLFRAALAVEYMQVGTLVSGTTYNVTRNLDGSGANAWPSGSVFLVLGTTNDGRIELNSYDTPRISVIHQGATYNAQTETIRLGDLNGNWGYAAETFGLALGEYASGKVNVTSDPTNGYRLRTHSTTHFSVTPSLLKFGGDVSAVGSTAISVFATAQTYNSESMGANDLLIGDNSASKANILWDYSAGKLLFRGGTTTQIEITTAGKLSAGGGDVVLDSGGIFFEGASGFRSSHQITWRDGATTYGIVGISDQPVGYPDGFMINSGNSMPIIINPATNVRIFGGLSVSIDHTSATATDGGALAVETSIAAGLDLILGSNDATAVGGRGGMLLFVEGTNNPGGELTAGSIMAVYMKADKFIIAYNDGGTIRYKYLLLSGTGVTWVHTTTAP